MAKRTKFSNRFPNVNRDNTGASGLNLPSMDGDKLVVPDVIASSDAQLRRLYTDLAGDHKVRFAEYAKIQRQFFGARPRDPKKLKELGKEWMSNINNGHAKTQVGRYYSSEFNLIDSVPSPVDCRVRLFSRSASPNGAEIDNRISKAFNYAYKEVYPEWDDYYTGLDEMRLERILYGLGITCRETVRKGKTWKYKSICADQFLCPLQTEVTSGSLSKFCIVHTKPAVELWDIYNNDVKVPFWNKEELGYLLWRCSTQYKTDSSVDWRKGIIEMQQRIRNYQVSVTSFYNTDIKLVSCYIREWGGKWSHGIIHQDYTAMGASEGTGLPIYFQKNRYEKLSDFFQLWTFESGQKYIHSVRGLGYRIFQPVEAQNRLDNVLIDQAHLAATVFVRTRQGRGKDLKQAAWVPGTINDIGEAEFVQQLAAANIQQTIAANSYQGQILERNNQFEGFDIDNPDNKYRTLGEVGMMATRDAVISKPAVNYFYRQLDTHFKNNFVLMYDNPDSFFEEFKELVTFEISDLKLPPEIIDELFKPKDLDESGLPKWLKVKASRSTSSGSQVADIISAKNMLTLTPFMTTDKRYLYLRKAAAAFSCYADAELYFPDSDRPNVLTAPMQKAMIEDGVLIAGNEVSVSPNDSHRDECPVHFNKCLEIIQQWGQQQISATQAMSQLIQLWPHALAHYIALSQDPWSKAIFEGLAPQRGEIENNVRQIQANAQAEQEAAQNEQIRKQQELEKVQRDQDPKRLKVILDNQRKTEEGQMKQSREAVKDTLQIQNEAVGSAVENELAIKDFALKQAREDAETTAEIRRSNAKAISTAAKR